MMMVRRQRRSNHMSDVEQLGQNDAQITRGSFIGGGFVEDIALAARDS